MAALEAVAPSPVGTPPVGASAAGVFVVGAPGSGTDAVHAALVAHPNLSGSPATGDFLAPLLVDLERIHHTGTQRGRLDWLSAQRVTLPELAAALGAGVSAFFERGPPGVRWVDHSPVYARMLDRLALLIPDARIVFVNRDGRENVAALTRRLPGLDHGTACQIWDRYATAWRRSGRSGLAILQVRHDRLADDPAGQLRRVLDFVGEPYDEGAERALVGALAAEPPADWHRWDRAERAGFVAEAGGSLVALGYASDSAWADGDGG